LRGQGTAIITGAGRAKGDGMKLKRVTGRELTGEHFRFYDFVMTAFVVILVLSNLIGAAKPSTVHLFGRDWVFTAGILFFPLSYIIDDVLTEVYGYARARRVVWAAAAALIFMAAMSWVVLHMPPTPDWKGQPAYEVVFGSTWRIVAASLTAFWAGDIVNSFVLAKMKILTDGKWLWTRTIGSTIFGEGVDSLVFYPVAFLGDWPTERVVDVLLLNWCLKVVWEIVLTPVTYIVVGFLKRTEGIEVFDVGTDFNPFETAV
jgi:uncharacterized integral membrane protein (TIGR00697 family)